MDYTTLSRTGLHVSVAGLGTGGFSRMGLKTGKTEDEAARLVRDAVELAVNFIDTARIYGAEGVVGITLKSIPRDRAGKTRRQWLERLAPPRVIGGTGAEVSPMQIRLPNGARKAITRLRPYPSLLLLAVPLAVVEPLKLAAVFVAGDGHVITGVFVIVCAYAVSLFLTERLFVIVRPKLMKLSWFAAIWRPFVRLRNRALRWVASFLPKRRTGLWLWDDSQ